MFDRQAARLAALGIFQTNMTSNLKAVEGFTLVELLVVMTVIALLAALLFPTIRAAKARARRTACLNNLQQINLGVRLYSEPPAGYDYQWCGD